MRLFDEDRIMRSGFWLSELLLFGVISACLMVVGFGIADLISGREIFARLCQWESQQLLLGAMIGPLAYGYLAGRLLKLGPAAQILAIILGISGGGAVLIMLVEMLLHLLIP